MNSGNLLVEEEEDTSWPRAVRPLSGKHDLPVSILYSIGAIDCKFGCRQRNIPKLRTGLKKTSFYSETFRMCRMSRQHSTHPLKGVEVVHGNLLN